MIEQTVEMKQKMLADGFPFCLMRGDTEERVLRHCNSCITAWIAVELKHQQGGEKGGKGVKREMAI